MSPDPIGPLTVAAAEAVRTAEVLRDQLAAALDRNHSARAQQTNYGWIDGAIWTLRGRLQAYQDGSLAEQATSIKAALDEVEAAGRSVQHVLSQLP